MPTPQDHIIWSLPTGSTITPLRDLHEGLDPAMPTWFTRGHIYVVESMHPIAEPPYVQVRTNDGIATKLFAEHISEHFSRT